MKILNISNMPIWLWGEGKGIPSIFFPQREFAARGYEVHFLCPLKEKESRYSLTEGIHIYRFDFPFNFRKSIYFQTDSLSGRVKASILSNLNWFFLQIYLLIHGLKKGIKIKPDIIYAHSLTSVFPAFLVSTVLKTKLIIRVYGTRQLYWKWDDVLYRIKECRDYLTFKVPADYFIFTNDGNNGNLLAEKLGVPERKIKNWRNGVDREFNEAVPEAKKELCDALNINPASKIIVSNNKLEQIVSAHGLSSKIYFMGIVDRHVIKNILHASDLFVLLSRYHNCTNTVWEAMSSGCCIVTVENDQIKEVLTSGENTVLVSQENIDQLPEILDTLMTNDSLRHELGKNARLRAGQVLESWPKRVEKEIMLLENMVNIQPRNAGQELKVNS